MSFLKAEYFYFFLQLIVFAVIVHGRCPLESNALPKISNGYISDAANIKLYAESTAEGYYDVQCEPGYALDMDSNGRITCLPSGSWSQPLPQCKSMGSCSISALFVFLQTTDGIEVIRSSRFIYTNGVDLNQALGGSNVTVKCANGYINTGGSLTIICTEANTWTTFPICTPIATTTATTAVTPILCPVTDDTFTFANGYKSDTTDLTIFNDGTAKGSVVITCSAGYVMDSVSGGVYRCNDGTWSARPFCTKTPRCTLTTLKKFMNDPDATEGLDISSQRLSVDSTQSDEVLIGSYILFYCQNGYKNTDSNLKVTCNEDGQWSTYPSCISLTTPRTTVRCPLVDDDLPTVPNSYRSNVDNVRRYSDGFAEGYYDVQCGSGYALNADIGGRITCLPSGSWSKPLPQCKSMGSCPIPVLFTFLQTSPGIRIDRSLSFIYTNGVDDNQALGGSNITVKCASGYKSTGDSLTIICTKANTWTTFPSCTPIATTTTAVSPNRCTVIDDTFIFANGYRSNTRDLTVFNDDTAKGSLVVTCSLGYAMDSVSGGVYRCNDGTWSPRPYCTKTKRCSLPALKDFMNDPVACKGLDVSSQRISIDSDENNEVLIGSYILFYCGNGYENTDNNLNVKCNANGQWSTYPSCTPTTTTAASDSSSTTAASNLQNSIVPTMSMGSNRRKK